MEEFKSYNYAGVLWSESGIAMIAIIYAERERNHNILTNVKLNESEFQDIKKRA
jgi:hypothetical protein